MSTELENAVRTLFADIAGTDSTGDPVIQQVDILNVVEEIRNHIENLEFAFRTRNEDAERWHIVKSGLFVSAPDEYGTIEVVYQNAWLDERAEEIYDTLPKTIVRPLRKGQVATPEQEERWSKRKGIVRDITPVVDHAIKVRDAERLDRIMRAIGQEVLSTEL